MPATVGGYEFVGLFRSPGPRLVGVRPLVVGEDGIDHRPGGLDRVLASEEPAVARVTRNVIERFTA